MNACGVVMGFINNLLMHFFGSLKKNKKIFLPPQLSRDCKVEVQRILHQRALDVKLDPELQKRCMTDLGKWCSEKLEAGQELECLQDHLEDLVSDCRDVVGNLTELESEVNDSPASATAHKTVFSQRYRQTNSNKYFLLLVLLKM